MTPGSLPSGLARRAGPLRRALGAQIAASAGAEALGGAWGGRSGGARDLCHARLPVRNGETTKEEDERDHTQQDRTSAAPVPGLVLIFSGTQPAFELIPLERGAIDVGRGEVGGVSIDD